MITIDDFKKVEIRTGTILEASEHPDADRLYILRVGIGGGERTLVAGIKPHYSPGELAGKQVLVVTNMEPAVIRGCKSEGMVLAASGGGGALTLITTDRKIGDGTRVT